jgi:hypothetical protein
MNKLLYTTVQTNIKIGLDVWTVFSKRLAMAMMDTIVAK